MAMHYARMPEHRCFLSKVEYREALERYWRMHWSGRGPGSCFAEVRVFDDGTAIFVVGH